MTVTNPKTVQSLKDMSEKKVYSGVWELRRIECSTVEGFELLKVVICYKFDPVRGVGLIHGDIVKHMMMMVKESSNCL